MSAAPVSGARWTPVRVKGIGIAALVICLAFAGLIMVLTAQGIADLSRLHVAAAVAVGLAHLLAYVAMLGALLAGRTVGRVPPGRFARFVFEVMRWSLVGLIIGGLGAAVILLLPGLADPFAIILTLIFVVAHLFATLLGVVLWRARTATRLTAGLFIAVVPAILVVIALNVAGIDVFPAWFESVMALAFASLGYELGFRRTASGSQYRPHESTG